MVVSNIFYFHPYLGKISNLININSKGLKPPTRLASFSITRPRLSRFHPEMWSLSVFLGGRDCLKIPGSLYLRKNRMDRSTPKNPIRVYSRILRISVIKGGMSSTPQYRELRQTLAQQEWVYCLQFSFLQTLTKIKDLDYLRLMVCPWDVLIFHSSIPYYPFGRSCFSRTNCSWVTALYQWQIHK